MSLPIISAKQRMAERKGVKLLMLGKSGIGKTTRLKDLDPNTTLFIDIEAGDLAVADWPGDTIRPASWPESRDFGTAHVNDGALHVKYELPKKVIWSQTILKEMAERIVASGDKVEDYIDIKLSVSESRYTNWPTALQEQFAAACTVEEGKPTITLTLDGGSA